MQKLIEAASRPGKIFFVLIAIIAIITTTDLVRLLNYEVHPLKPDVPIQLQQDQVYRELKAGEIISDWNRLEGAFQFIDGQYDCSDFRLVNLLRILYEFGESIPDTSVKSIENTLFNFRYWWDEPGENSMCYWSENHQILFAMAEHLAGQKYKDVVFMNSGLTGAQHMEKARIRILDWLEMRWKYGFTEFNSEVYYKEDIGALINLIDFSEDSEITTKAMIILDLLIYDVAAQSIGSMFVTATGRSYQNSRKGGPNISLGNFTNYLRRESDMITSGIMQALAYSEKYHIPAVFTEIIHDTNTVVIRLSNGMDLSELKAEGYDGTDSRSMMMQWGMEAFSNPETIGKTMHIVRKYKMFGNWFLKDLKYMDFTLIRMFGIEPFLSRLLNPQTNGVAIQRGNTYTYRTADYSIYTAQKYHPGTYGDQQHISGMNVSDRFCIFHNHPALEKDVKHQSPNYWVGYGHLPHVAQDENVSMAIYHLPDKKGWLEMSLLDYTHAYFPTELFDTTMFHGNRIFGKSGNTYCALIGNNELQFREGTTDDLLQQGKNTCWIIEAGSKKEDGTFCDFVSRIMENEVHFDEQNLILNYKSKGKTYRLTFRKDFLVNGKPVDIDYPRFDSPYCREARKPETITISHNGKSLFLDFYNTIRTIQK